MTFTARIPIKWWQYAAGAVDAEGNPTEGYTPALDAAGTDLKVISVGRGVRSSEPEIGRVVEQPRMAAPPDCPIRAQDVVELPNGDRYEVDGDPDDQTLGHHGWKPGIVVWLRRVTG